MLDLSNLKNDFEGAKQTLADLQNNMIKGMNLDDFIYNKLAAKFDPIQYIERVLRAHLPESKRHLHENQIELVRAVCNPKIRKVAALMARQCFAKGTKIRMADNSLKPVELIKLGDKVKTPTGNANVIFTTTGVDQLYKIRSDNCQEYIVTGNHKLAIYNNGHYDIQTVNNLIKQYTYSIPTNIYGYRNVSDNKFYNFIIEPYKVDNYYGITINDKNNLILIGDDNIVTHNSGKCFKKGTKIMMADGNIKQVENIQIGDYVMSPKSTPVLVTALGHGSEEMFTIKPKDKYYSGFTVNKSHILSLFDKDKNQYINITVADYVKLDDNKKNKLYGYRAPVEFDEVKLPIDPYFIGLWLGDGSKSYPEIATIDKEIINYLTDYANQLNMQLVVYKGDDTHINTYAITNKQDGKRNNKNILTQWLRIFDLLNNKHIPNVILHNSINIRRQVLAGLIDSDGSSATNTHTVELTFASEQLANGVLQLLRTLGYKASIHLKNIILKQTNKECQAYRIHAYGDFSVIPTKIPRKQFNGDIYKDPLKFKFDIIPENVNEYYGFTVDANDGLFLLEDCTVVHNTESIASFSGYLLDNYPNMRIGIFTPRVQQAEVNVGRTSIFFQMNEDRLNNKLVKCTKQKIELSNGSYVSAVSGSDQSNIEGLTFDIIILDEAQKISNYTWSERISPMGWHVCILTAPLLSN